MFNMLIIIIGLFEFCIGCVISVFAKSEMVSKYTQFLYDFAGDDLSVAIPLNKWIGENYALSGSLYVFFASIIKTLNLNFIILILLISLVEIYSYKRINKGIIKILKIHNKHL